MTALTIAGFDPSSGAGTTADLQVFAAHGIFGTSAITALTIQSTLGVRRSEAVDPVILRDTLQTLDDDLPPAGIKIGMLGGEPQVREVIAYLKSVPRRTIVLDPVIRSSSGALLLSPAGLDLLRNELLPLVDVITPNVAELAILTQSSFATEEEQKASAQRLSEGIGAAVVVTGGDRLTPDDLIFADGAWTTLSGQHIRTNATHGTGCAFSSALLCGLLKGSTVVTSAVEAKEYVAEAMRSATPRGHGKGPMNLLWPLAAHSGD